MVIYRNESLYDCCYNCGDMIFIIFFFVIIFFIFLRIVIFIWGLLEYLFWGISLVCIDGCGFFCFRFRILEGNFFELFCFEFVGGFKYGQIIMVIYFGYRVFNDGQVRELFLFCGDLGDCCYGGYWRMCIDVFVILIV